tara:strand:+ start:736 stop:1605 length:870 start_codon:yes stop_codon:yes gene_type:complete
MSKLALGTVQFGMKYGIANDSNVFPQSEIKEILKLAALKNINTIDTAIAYGSSEENLGKEKLDPFNIITKLQSLPDDKRNISLWVKKEINSSLERLNQKKVYGVLLHNTKDLSGVHGNAIYDALLELKENNLISKIGVSIYSPDELDEVIPKFKIDIVQSPFNVFDTRLQNSGWMEELHNMNIKIHTRSTFLQGLLLMQEEKIPSKFSKWKSLFNAWNEEIANKNITKMEACLQFSCSFKEIDRVIFGVDNLKQFKEVIGYDFLNDLNNLTSFSSTDESLINPSKWNIL